MDIADPAEPAPHASLFLSLESYAGPVINGVKSEEHVAMVVDRLFGE